MADDKIIELYNKIQENYYERNFNETLDLINEYFETNTFGITDKILTMYVDSCVGLNKFEEAIKTLNLIEKLYASTYNKFFLAKRYIYCFEFNKAINIIDNNEFDGKDYHDLAKRFLLAGEYYLANKYFEKCISVSNEDFYKQSSISYISKIQKHIKEGAFLEQEYNSFKRRGECLKPGYVIYAKVEDSEYKKIDPVSDKRPYMIWKISGDNLYCFPLSQKTNSNNGNQCGYILYYQKYLNFDSDRAVKEILVTIKDKNVQKVYEKILDEDFELVLKSIYNTICVYDKKEKNEKFITDYIENMNIDLGDIIILLESEKKSKRYYYVLNITNQKKKYQVIELSYNKDLDQFSILDNNPTYIRDNKLIRSVIKLDEEKKSYLDIEINKIKKVNAVVGNIVSYNDRKLLIIKEDKNLYTCVDKTDNIDLSFIRVEYLSKDADYCIIEKITPEELIKQKHYFKEYLSNNAKSINKQKKLNLKSYIKV